MLVRSIRKGLLRTFRHAADAKAQPLATMHGSPTCEYLKTMDDRRPVGELWPKTVNTPDMTAYTGVVFGNGISPNRGSHQESCLWANPGLVLRRWADRHNGQRGQTVY